MSKSLRTTLIVIATMVASAILLLSGFNIGRASISLYGNWPANMMTGYNADPMEEDRVPYERQMGEGIMGGGMISGCGMMESAMMAPGMMGGFGNSGLYGVEALTLAEAQDAVQTYIDTLGNEDLMVSEVMVFDNHAYAQIAEKSTGIGAMELLVDPVTLAVYPEHGPNMMWNLKYSPMSEFGRLGMMGMVGGSNLSKISGEMPVSAEQAIEVAQRYLDTYLPGAESDETADPFYGYYTLHILRDGKTASMLSVNGYTRQVFLHTWHGDLLEMSDGHDD